MALEAHDRPGSGTQSLPELCGRCIYFQPCLCLHLLLILTRFARGASQAALGAVDRPHYQNLVLSGVLRSCEMVSHQ